MQSFLVFKCPKCGAFLYAPINQKTRRCTYCNHIIKINPSQCQLVESIQKASELVKKYNAKKNTDEFRMAVESSRESILKIYDYLEHQNTAATPESDTVYISGGKSRTLFSLLIKYAKQPVSLDYFRKISEQNKLDWQWVTESLEKLSHDGVIIFPRPWEIQLVSEENLPGIKGETKSKRKISSKSLEHMIIQILETHSMPVKIRIIVEELIKYGYDEEEIRKIIDKMISNGIIYEPRIEWISLI